MLNKKLYKFALFITLVYCNMIKNLFCKDSFFAIALKLAGFPSPYFNAYFEVLHEKRVMELTNLE